MGFIPKGARWYLADIVLEFTIEGDHRNVVHVNTHLIEADSPEQAYQKALERGREATHEYPNTEGNLVRVAFRGLRNLAVIDDDLEDGAELFYEESLDISEEELKEWVSSKEELCVFAPLENSTEDRPNYMPKRIRRHAGSRGTRVTGFPQRDT